MDVSETKNVDLFIKAHNFEPMKAHTFETNIRLIRLFSLMLNCAKPRLFAFFNGRSCLASYVTLRLLCGSLLVTFSIGLTLLQDFKRSFLRCELQKLALTSMFSGLLIVVSN